MLLLALGDAHIPDRAIDIPLKFKKLLSIPDKIAHVAILGNSTRSSEFLDFARLVSSNITIVRGELDNATIRDVTDEGSKAEVTLPVNAIIKQGQFKIGCCSGYNVVPKNDPLALLALARQLDVDILLWGGTHNVEAYTLEDKFFVNPGSCTGALTTDWPVTSTLAQPSSDKASLKETEKLGKEKEDPQPDTSDKDMEESEEKSTKTGQEEERELEEEDIEISEFDLTGSNVPSFCLLDIQGNTCTLYIYMYIDNEVKVDKVVYEK
ncbi:hypothetical protein KAFR_0C05770 [Kazachstania africana CBS 2517]|uniref:Vacuolar protein sorting-associated protein 29 n=1 Tax=Kazachstania africana (strain ATCC 22294 / BCRC 22015 / CBS 2517 / CECT 1963 / NBRC 1671 / NRRL Y-8276) TaxID=1071382 RepID=H2AT68_KAZAF|nr:hypothetical protein KAFR_0C05770 [Kazachstania africana CBS 2517]CCF57568.1 hypothetical protein KAFR_0C05770 [Kazachstania africana CBS 2517]